MEKRIKIRLVLFYCAAAFIVCTNGYAQETSYTLKGRIGQLQAPAKAYLLYTNKLGRQTDSAIFNDGTFTFAGKLDQPKAALLYVSKSGGGLATSESGYVLFYLENGNIYVNSPDSIQNAKVSGGPINTDNNHINIALKYNSRSFSNGLV